MGDARGSRSLHAPGRVRARRPACRRGDDDTGDLPVTRVTLYHTAGCHLCERARQVVEGVRDEVPFDLEEIDIAGMPELEQLYREWLPVVEIDGQRAFVYYVDAPAFHRKLAAQSRA